MQCTNTTTVILNKVQWSHSYKYQRWYVGDKTVCIHVTQFCFFTIRWFYVIIPKVMQQYFNVSLNSSIESPKQTDLYISIPVFFISIAEKIFFKIIFSLFLLDQYSYQYMVFSQAYWLNLITLWTFFQN